MLFNSFVFLLLFLPIAVVGYFGLNRINDRAARLFLVGMSLWFYGYFNPHYLLIIASSVALNYLFGKRLNGNGGAKKSVLALALAFNLGLIFVFKYYDFFIENVNAAFRANLPLLQVMLPLGISFFTFQQISYVVDSYYGRTEDYRFDEYALFVTFFPQLVAGPIVLHSEMIPQFRDGEKRKFDWDNFAAGMMAFTIGLFKKMEIADTFGRIVDWGFSDTAAMTPADIFLVMLSYTLQIYFDFSGYSDMAVGLGKMFNFDIPQNFNSPYRSLSIIEFWNRWHLTLTRFLRMYVYIPLGGNRKGTARTYLNVMAVFLVSGLWHGANWTFVLWGLLHGAANVLTRMCGKMYERIPRALRWLGTFSVVNVLWLLFRAESVGQWWYLLRRMARVVPWKVTVSLDDTFFVLAKNIPNVFGNASDMDATSVFSIVIVPFILIILILCIRGKNLFERELLTNWKTLGITAILLLFCIISFSRQSAFIYFNF